MSSTPSTPTPITREDRMALTLGVLSRAPLDSVIRYVKQYEAFLLELEPASRDTSEYSFGAPRESRPPQAGPAKK